ncbi:hypothetical protein M406DRAFT_99725 [Cryphonectria parasitica EP155]|uniref:UDENN FLCN/SMCR8-type domain-containing protein n=1 Tax=Cryphonectria parasitica (strain ATCC 38755 / EP155) TaxID=660469 RepID=A0A9P4XZA4_CRYP1|nr:uncharacterized protein M406DRAFT_99725 [Cryphonectria parasitica EP155]KAF3763649.1 hypothetical protein M406DRAFT_99725 [Cryphonectria parasitica EP155]
MFHLLFQHSDPIHLLVLLYSNLLCLAHYCDVHGPTPLMVTEGLPIPCAACYEDIPYTSNNNTKTDVRTTIAEALRRLNLDSKRSSLGSASAAVSDHDEPTGYGALRRTTQLASASSTVDTPPVSPRYPPESSASTGGGHHGRRESSYRRTYDETTTRRAGPCENCAMTLPRRKESTTKSRGGDGSDNETGPILRTKAPYARVYGSGVTPGDASPPNSTSTVSDDDGYYEDERTPSHHRAGTITSTTSRSSASSPSGAGAVHSHMHFLHYTSSHEPVVPSSFSIVRASCIRTLSFETLPRGAPTAAATTTTMMGSSGGAGPITSAITSPVTPGFITTHSSGAAASGGPIFFGDPSAGYTTAYIFRIPDVHARGHKRVYAFLALSTHRERLAMKTFTFISTAFRELAAWIQGLAEAEAEAERYSSGNGPFSPMTAAQSSQPPQTPAMETSNSSTAAGSGFLSSGVGGLSRRMGGGYGYGGSGVALKARGLPELVGLPDFFLELHQKFVQLLLELGVVLSS